MTKFRYFSELEEFDALELLAISFCMIDKDFHRKEEEYLVGENFSKEKIANLKNFIDRNANNSPESVFKHALELIPDDEKEIAVLHLVEIAWADGKIAEEEKKFLKLVEDFWEIDIDYKAADIWKPTEEQKEIIETAPDGKLTVEAVPGCGKTTTACARIAYLRDKCGLEADSILFFSFTNQAIKALEEKIADMSVQDTVENGKIKISTIDRQAALILNNFSGDKNLTLTDYDQTVISSLQILEDPDKNKGIKDFFDNVKHIVLDEAQDIVGIRAKWIVALLKIVDKNCGITIFSDPAQALYDFDFESSEQLENLSEILDQENINSEFNKKFLTKIQRTDNPDLISFIENFHDIAAYRVECGLDDLRKMKLSIKNLASTNLHQFTPEAIKKLEQEFLNGLILFRQNGEVSQASHSLLSSRNPTHHRLRQSYREPIIEPWLGIIFSEYEEDLINQEKFNAIWETKKLIPLISEKSKKICWDLLYEFAPFERKEPKQVDLRRLRRLLSAERVNSNFTSPDIGHWGPIIGTVHSSKGREADNVAYFMEQFGKEPSSEDELLREARVMYVASSRPKNKLIIGEANIPYVSFYRKGKGNRKFSIDKLDISMEIGLKNDFDDFSLVDKNLYEDKDQVFNIQNFMMQSVNPDLAPPKLGLINKKYADKNDPKYRRFEVSILENNINKEHKIGMMSDIFTKSVWDIINLTKKKYFSRPPSSIRELYLVGVKTVVMSYDDERLSRMHPPYSKSGFWLAPCFGGYPTFIHEVSLN